jgi:hypothetical protein
MYGGLFGCIDEGGGGRIRGSVYGVCDLQYYIEAIVLWTKLVRWLSAYEGRWTNIRDERYYCCISYNVTFVVVGRR